MSVAVTGCAGQAVSNLREHCVDPRNGPLCLGRPGSISPGLSIYPALRSPDIIVSAAADKAVQDTEHPDDAHDQPIGQASSRKARIASASRHPPVDYVFDGTGAMLPSTMRPMAERLWRLKLASRSPSA